MSWQLLVPVMERLVTAGIEYYNSDSSTQEAVSSTTKPKLETKDITEAVLLVSMKIKPTKDVVDLKAKLTEVILSLDEVEEVKLELEGGG